RAHPAQRPGNRRRHRHRHRRPALARALRGGARRGRRRTPASARLAGSGGSGAAHGPLLHQAAAHLLQRPRRPAPGDGLMRRFLALAAGLIAAWLVLASPAAADPELVEFHIDAPDRLTVGDRYRYVVTLEGPAGTEAGLAPGSLPPELALISQPTPQRSDLGDGRERIVLEIEVAVFQTGAVEVPALSIEFQQPDGARGTIATPPSVVAVASVLPATGELTPRDLKPQAEIGRASALGSILTALAIVLAALLLVLLGL